MTRADVMVGRAASVKKTHFPVSPLDGVKACAGLVWTLQERDLGCAGLSPSHHHPLGGEERGPEDQGLGAQPSEMLRPRLGLQLERPGMQVWKPTPTPKGAHETHL